jgi:hypothetical protein
MAGSRSSRISSTSPGSTEPAEKTLTPLTLRLVASSEPV